MLFFLSEPAPRLRDHHRHGWVHYIDTTKITVLMFVWYCLVFNQYSYYRDFFCSRPALRIRNRHHHVLVQYIDNTKFTVVCMSLLLLSIDLQQLCYYVLFKNDQWCNGEMVDS